MKFKGLLVGAALLALLGGCATYDDGYAYGNYGDGRYYSYRNDGYYRYNDRRWEGERSYYRRGPDFSRGFNYNDR